jgi:hypothetical protein
VLGVFRLEQDGRKCAGLFWTFMALSPILKTPNTSVLGFFCLEQYVIKCAGLFWTFMALSPI